MSDVFLFEQALETLLEKFADRLSKKIVADVMAALGATHVTDARIALTDVADHGAPSKRWIEGPSPRRPNHDLRPARCSVRERAVINLEQRRAARSAA